MHRRPPAGRRLPGLRSKRALPSRRRRRPVSALDRPPVIPNGRDIPLRVDRDPRFRGRLGDHFSYVDWFLPAPTGRPVDGLHEGLASPRITFPDHGRVAASVNGDLRRLRILGTGQSFTAFFNLFGFRKIDRRLPAFTGRAVGTLNDGVGAVPCDPRRRWRRLRSRARPADARRVRQLRRCRLEKASPPEQLAR